MRIAPTDTTPLSDEDSPDSPRPRPEAKKAQPPNSRGAQPSASRKAQPPNSRGAQRSNARKAQTSNARKAQPSNSRDAQPSRNALRVDGAPRSPKDADPGTETKSSLQTKGDPNADSQLKVKAAPAAAQEPKPLWAPEPLRTPKPTASLDRATDAPPSIPSWERGRTSTSRSDEPWEGHDGTPPPDVPVHAPPHTRRGRRPRSRVFVTMAVVLCFVAAVVAGAAIVSAFHNPTTPTVHSGAASIPKVPSPGVARVEAATDKAEAATNTARSKLIAMSGFPTLSKVSAIVNPYVEALQHYETALTDIAVPARAKAAVDSVRSLAGQNARFLFSINVLPSLGLGAYLAEFTQRATQLQLDFREVRGALAAETG